MTDTHHPAVAAVESHLASGGVRATVTWFDESTSTAVQAAAALGVDVGAIANSLIFMLDSEVLLILASGAHRVDTDWVGERLGGVLARATAKTVREATGQVIGGVAPVGHPQRIRTLVDEALGEYDEVWASAGHPHAVFSTTFDELVRVTGGEPVSVVRPVG